VINCHDSVIYILAPLRYATIYGCSDATIVLGAVGKAVRVEHCERVHLIIAAKRVCIANCRECLFFLGVNQRPLVVGDNHKLQADPGIFMFYSIICELLLLSILSVRQLAIDGSGGFCSGHEHQWRTPQEGFPCSFSSWQNNVHYSFLTQLSPFRTILVAPYNTFYSQLEEHMTEVGIQATMNRWDEPLALGAVDPHDSLSHPAGVSDAQAESAAQLDPDQFTNFLIPNWFEGESAGSTKDNPFPLPDAYLKSQLRNQKNLSEIKQILREAPLEENRKRELSCVLHVYFKDWLYGNPLSLLPVTYVSYTAYKVIETLRLDGMIRQVDGFNSFSSPLPDGRVIAVGGQETS
ncbi:hypothetical protein Gohar_017755, partial [Gossypium harknessii]|nr:hypothetical protein [Gossypium harknessii]